MELWIRSQDKTTLTKTETLVIEDNMIVDYYQKRIVLGEYKSEERALEVLDEIDDILKPRMVLTKLGDIVTKTCDGTIYSKPNEYDIKEMSTYVYQMPKD